MSRRFSLFVLCFVLMLTLIPGIMAVSVKMLSNTPNCFSCETVYEICKESSKDDSSKVDVQYLNAGPVAYSGPKEAYVINTIEKTSSRPIYGPVEASVAAFDNKTGQLTAKTITTRSIIGYEEATWAEQTYTKVAPDKLDIAQLKDGSCYKFSVKGTLKAGHAVDNVLVIGGVSYTEWAWWNNTYNRRMNVTLVNNYTDILTNYPVSVSINTSDSALWGDCSALQVIKDEISPLNWWNSTGCGSDATVIWFRANISAMSNSTSYAIYYANLTAAAAGMHTNQTDIEGLGAYKDASMAYYWPMDEASGNAGSVGINPDSLTPSAGTTKVTDGSCRYGNCFNTAGTGRLDGPAIAVVPQIGQNNTIECWVKPNSLTGTIWMLGNDNAVIGSTQFMISGNRLTYQIYDGNGCCYPQGYSTATISATGAWMHVAGRYNSSGTFFATYINGVYDTEGWAEQGNDVHSGGMSIAIGSYKSGATAYSDAVYDECAFWQRALNDTELKHHALFYQISSSAKEETQVTTSLSFANQVPANLTAFNFINKLVNVTYGFTGMNDSSFNIQVKSNGSSPYWLHINGSSISGNQTHSCTNTSSSAIRCQLDDNEILPGNYNINPDEHENNVHTALATLSGANDYYKVGLNNVSCISYGWLEFMVNGTGATPMPVIYCNSSYTTGSPATSPYCAQIAAIPANQPYNHSHSPGYAGHHVVPFASSITGCTIGGIYITPKSYFIFKGGANEPKIWGTSNASNPINQQLSANGGNTWTSQPGVTADLHLHQLLDPTDFHYTVCGIISSSGLPYCDLMRTDRLELVPLPPTQASIYDVPEFIERFSLVNVNWTAASSPNGYAISYNLTLRDNATLAVSDLYITNGTTYPFNASAAVGRYVFALRSFDSSGLYAPDDYSNSFQICIRNYTCTEFHACSVNNVSVCEVVTDLGCAFPYTGNLTDYDEVCTYVLDTHLTLFNFNLDLSNSVMLLFVVSFLWLGCVAIGFMFQNEGFFVLGMVLGFTIGIMLFQLSWVLTLAFILLDIAMWVFIRGLN